MNSSAFPPVFATTLPSSYLPRATITTPVRLLREYQYWSDTHTAPIIGLFRNPDLLRSVRAYYQGDLCLLKGRGRWEGQGTFVFSENLSKCVLLDDTRRREGEIVMSDGSRHSRESCWWLGVSSIPTIVAKTIVKRRLPDISGNTPRDETICPVCLDDFKDISGTPIECPNHHKVCVVCYDRLSPKKCPTCRASYRREEDRLVLVSETTSVSFADESHLCGVLKRVYDGTSSLTYEDRIVLESLWAWLQDENRYGGRVLNDDRTLSVCSAEWLDVVGSWVESFVIWFLKDGKERLRKMRLNLTDYDISETRLIRILREIHGDTQALTLLAENTSPSQRQILRSVVWVHRFFGRLNDGEDNSGCRTFEKVLAHLKRVLEQVVWFPEHRETEPLIRITRNTTILEN
jgi:hypothetical protein